MSDAPEPLVPAEVNLRDFGFMPLDVLRLRDSDLAAVATGDEFKAAILLWCFAWHQVPAASIPNDDRILAKHSGAGADWRKVKAIAMRGFIECSDGRLYHQVIAVKALEAWERREEFQEVQDNKESRQKRWRERVKYLSTLLRDAGVTPPMNASSSELARLCTLHVDGFVDTEPSTRASTRASTDPSAPASTETAMTGTGTETLDRDKRKEKARAISEADARASGLNPNPDPDPEPQEPTPAGLVCRAMRKAGLSAVNPGDPRLLALLAQGATEAEFAGLAAEAVAKGKGFAWVLVALQARRAEAAEIALTPTPREDPNAWAKTRSGVVNRACQLGIGPFDEVAAHVGSGPSWSAYRIRVINADAQSEGAAA